MVNVQTTNFADNWTTVWVDTVGFDRYEGFQWFMSRAMDCARGLVRGGGRIVVRVSDVKYGEMIVDSLFRGAALGVEGDVDEVDRFVRGMADDSIFVTCVLLLTTKGVVVPDPSQVRSWFEGADAATTGILAAFISDSDEREGILVFRTSDAATVRDVVEAQAAVGCVDWKGGPISKAELPIDSGPIGVLWCVPGPPPSWRFSFREFSRPLFLITLALAVAIAVAIALAA